MITPTKRWYRYSRYSRLTRRQAAGALLAASALLMAGCGFKLRGAVELPFDSLWTNFSTATPIGAEFRRVLRSGNPNLKISEQREQAQVVLNILSESRDKVVLGLSSAGAVREYQLLIKLRYEILGPKGLELNPAQDIVLKRDVTTNDAQVVAKEREDELLFREMQSDLVQQLMRRLASVRIKT